MKGLTTMCFFAFIYLVIIIIFNEVAGEPRGVQEGNIGQSVSGAKSDEEGTQGNGAKNGSAKQPVDQTKFGSEATKETPSQKEKENATNKQKVRATTPDGKNSTNPLADLFQISDPVMRNYMGAVYGAYRGNDQCTRKAFCYMGNYMKDLPGRDLLFLVMGNYVPSEYSLYYEIFKAAIMYGQNCDVYVCIPENDPSNNAASAARPAQQPPIPADLSQKPAVQTNNFPR